MARNSGCSVWVPTRLLPRLSALPCCLQVTARYGQVVGLAERHFAAIRQSVAEQAAPTTLMAAFLEPVSRDLATQLSVHLFARTDAHFMSWFTCAPFGHPTPFAVAGYA